MEYIAGDSAQDKGVEMKGKTLHIIRPCHKIPYIQKNSDNRAHQSQRTWDWGNQKRLGTTMTVRIGEGIIENNMPPVKVEHHHANYTGLEWSNIYQERAHRKHRQMRRNRYKHGTVITGYVMTNIRVTAHVLSTIKEEMWRSATYPWAW